MKFNELAKIDIVKINFSLSKRFTRLYIVNNVSEKDPITFKIILFYFVVVVVVVSVFVVLLVLYIFPVNFNIAVGNLGPDFCT
jgi:hypothetical protein